MRVKLDENLPMSVAAIVIDAAMRDAATTLVQSHDLNRLAGCVAVMQNGMLRIRHP